MVDRVSAFANGSGRLPGIFVHPYSRKEELALFNEVKAEEQNGLIDILLGHNDVRGLLQATAEQPAFVILGSGIRATVRVSKDPSKGDAAMHFWRLHSGSPSKDHAWPGINVYCGGYWPGISAYADDRTMDGISGFQSSGDMWP